VQAWREELAALGGRDPLLSFRDLKVGTLDLAAAEPEARRKLLDGESVLLSRLFPHEPLRSSALRSTRAIRDKSRELLEERGLSVGLLAVGIATWANPFVAHRPTAPVLLRTAAVVARDPAETDFVITVADDPVVNPVLLHALDAQLGLRFHADDLRDHSGQLKYTTVVEKLREFAPAHVVDGFSIAHRAVLATFSTEPLLLTRDLEDLGAELEHHDIIAALAGDERARAAVSADPVPATPEFVVLDTDADQLDVLATVAGGGNVLVDAPPGTGRTQTVAALVAELVGRGKRVLVASQTRATATALMSRLESAGLADAVLDVGGTSPLDAVHQIIDAARRLHAAAPPSGDDPVPSPGAVNEAERLGNELEAYHEALHRVREPGDISVYDAMVTLATTPESARTSVRISPEALDMAPAANDLRAQLKEYADLEGLTLTEEGSLWFGADVPTPAAADSLSTTVAGLRDIYVPQLRDAATRAAVEVGLAGPTTIAECFAIVELLSSVASTNKRFGGTVWNEPLDDLVAATSARSDREQFQTRPGFFARRRLRGRALELADRSSRRQRESVHAQLAAAKAQLAAWKERSRDGKPPRTGEYLPKAIESVTAARRRLSVLAEANPRATDLAELSFAEATRRLDELAKDDAHLRALPTLTKLAADLRTAGLDPLLDDLRRRGIRPERVEDVLEYARLSSLLDHWRKTDPALSRFDIAGQRRTVEEFCAADRERVREAAQRVRRAHAAHFAQVTEDYEGQADVLLGLTRGPALDVPRTLRQLVDTAPEVALAAMPCWVMSPLAVAEVLPPRRLFDVVIMEDAGRVAVAHAVPVVARADRIVAIADDEVALTSFSTAVEPAPDPDEQEGPWSGEPPPSVAELLRGVLPTRTLRWPYRYRDDRLVGFAASTTYAGRLTTVPGAGGNPRVSLELVDAPVGGDDPVDSSSAEVARVVELVLEHLRARPHESLGVLTLGPRHAERLDAALRRALVRAPDVANLLHEDRAEAFFVKDVERVAGDVRDAIILSLGYGRSVDGRILYRFGALGRPGGERRLVSATTRARERLMVVSTFGADDLSPRRLTTPGSQALGEFLAYVERGARVPDRERGHDDVLAQVIAGKLRQAGAAVEIGYGGTGGVAVAVRHPSRRARFVLAVETDGRDPSARTSARERERLRPALLARLGWAVHRVWVEAWVTDPDGEAERLIQAYQDAVDAADAYDWAVASAEADDVAGLPEEADDPEAGVGPGAAASVVADDEADDTTESGPDGDAQQGDASDDGVPAGVTDDPSANSGLAPETPSRTGARPALQPGWNISDYTGRELAAMAHWVESDGVSRRVADVVDLIAADLGLSLDDARTRDVLRHAVRVARAGAPSSQMIM
jgi:KaiC/GvpD/RAD55 family RecA-like ATPase